MNANGAKYISQIDEVRRISIFKPKSTTPFLVLGRRRHFDGPDPRAYSIARVLVEDACRVITNCYDKAVFLTDTPDGTIPIVDDLLLGSKYYFNIRGVANYSVVPLQFSQWIPPARNAVPAHWFGKDCPQTQEPDNVIPQDGFDLDFSGSVSDKVKAYWPNCWMTGVRGPIRLNEAAHIVPFSFNEWYAKYALYKQFRYPIPLPVAHPTCNDYRNFLVLRTELHRSWDDGTLTFYPLEKAGWIAVYIKTTVDDTASLYHMHLCRFPPQVEAYVMFVRFAKTILQIHRETIGCYAQTLEEMGTAGVLTGRVRKRLSPSKQSTDTQSRDSSEPQKRRKFDQGTSANSASAEEPAQEDDPSLVLADHNDGLSGNHMARILDWMAGHPSKFELVPDVPPCLKNID